MEENNINNFDAFLNKAVKEVGFEIPSREFTNSIMAKLSISKEPQLIIYKPLISAFGWWSLILCLFLGLFSTLFYHQDKKNDSGFTGVFKDVFNFNTFDKISSIVLSDATTYAILGLILFLYIQLFIFRKYRSQSFAV